MQIRYFLLFSLLAATLGWSAGSPAPACLPDLAALRFEPGPEASPIARKFYETLKENFPGEVDFYRLGAHRKESDHPALVRVVPRSASSNFTPLVVKTVKDDTPKDREAFQREGRILESMPKTDFVNLVAHRDLETAVGGKLPLVVLENYPDGDLAKSLSSLGSSVPPLELLKLMEQTVRALDQLHRAGWANGDVKAENFVVKKENGKVAEIKMMDLGNAHRLDVAFEGIPSFTPQYLDGNSLQAVGIWNALVSLEKRDLNALRKTHQEMILGQTLGKIPAAFTSVFKFKGNIVDLKVSPREVDGQAHPILDMLSWIHFNDTGSWLTAIEKAEAALGTGKPQVFYGAVFAMYEREGRLDEFVELVATRKGFQEAYRQNYFGIGYFPGAGLELRKSISARLTP